MTLRETRYYGSGPVDVYAMITDPEFQRRVMVATHALSHHVDVDRPVGSPSSGPAVVTTRRTLATSKAPDAVGRMLGPTVLVTQVTTWGEGDASGSRSGTTTVAMEGVPVKVTGTIRLSPAADGTGETVEFEVSSKIPLFGGRIVEAARPLVAAALDTEHHVGEAWLAAR